MMDRRENMLAILHHQPHDHVGDVMHDICMTGGNLETFDSGPFGGGFDGFGCKWAASASALGAGVPDGSRFVLENICDWEDVVHFPDLDAYDWAGQAAQQLARFNPKQQVQEYCMWNAQFLCLTHLMGFENGLCALYEEPEACSALLNAITDYKIRNAEYAVKFFRPDTICAYDDVATELSTFMSPEKYRELIKPMHKRFNDAVRAMGVIPNLHVCGRCEAIVPDFVDEGAAAWEICQPENDLCALQKTLGNQLAFLGGYDMKGAYAYLEPTEAQLRASVRQTIDKYAPGGNYAFFGLMLYSDPGRFASTISILSDEAVRYGTGYYCKL